MSEQKMDTMTDLQNELRLLRHRCNFLEQEVAQKNRQISELQKAHEGLKEIKRSASLHVIQPTMALKALPIEFEAVKKGLAETVDKCQQLLQHLDLVTQAKTPETSMRDFQTQTSVVAEGLEEHTTGLKATVNDLHQKLDIWRESHIFHPQSIQHETFQDVFVLYQEAKNEQELLRAQNLSLNHRLDRCYQLIDSLNSEKRTRDAEAKECIEVLKQQNITFTEDFLDERRDREAAQGRVAELEAEVASLRRVIQKRDVELVDDIRQRREQALEQYRLKYEQSHPRSLFQTDLLPDRHPMLVDEDMGVDVVDGRSLSQPVSLP